jgi:hypothetical protein
MMIIITFNYYYFYNLVISKNLNQSEPILIIVQAGGQEDRVS